jgi:SAM-dependent methyltransferase
VGAADPNELRVEMIECWEGAAAGWGKRAAELREWSMPVSSWMIEQAQLEPGLGVLELAAGPGELGFLAAELIRPGGTLICSDGAEAMLDVARARAAELGIENVEFKRLELEWIDLETASVERVLCKWGLMLIVDPEAALRETRRVLAPGGRIAVAVWDEPAVNPWATIPTRALVELGHTAPPDRDGPGMFALAAPGRLQDLLESAGFLDVVVDSVELSRTSAGVEGFVTATSDVSSAFREVFQALPDGERQEVVRKIAALAEPYTAVDGSVRLPARTLVAAADA